MIEKTSSTAVTGEAKQDSSSVRLLFGINVITVYPTFVTSNDILRRYSQKTVAVSDHQSRVLAQILLRPAACINLPLKRCDMNHWIFQPLLQLLGQSTDNFHG
jgi:hypothetical protein